MAALLPIPPRRGQVARLQPRRQVDYHCVNSRFQSGDPRTRHTTLHPPQIKISGRRREATRLPDHPTRSRVLIRVPGMEYSFGGGSPLQARQGELLAGRQGCPPRGGIRRKPQAKRWPDEQESHMRRLCWMRRRFSSKSYTCTESMDVYAAGISVKVDTSYPGRSARLPQATGVERRRDGRAEVSRWHSRSIDRTEGQNMKY